MVVVVMVPNPPPAPKNVKVFNAQGTGKRFRGVSLLSLTCYANEDTRSISFLGGLGAVGR